MLRTEGLPRPAAVLAGLRSVPRLNLANAVTAGRLVLLGALVVFLFSAPAPWRLSGPLWVILIFVLDGLDGALARRRGEVSVFGAWFDVMADRVTENVLWICLWALQLIPIWVPAVFLLRGVGVDLLRWRAAGSGQAPFAVTRLRLGGWLVQSRFMRILYAVVKATAFSWWLMVQPLSEVLPALWLDWQGPLVLVGNALTFLAVSLCLLRALPVVLR